MPNSYYVYFHICRSTGRTFYIGKGKGKRAYEMNNRSIKWKAYVAENAYDVYLYKVGLTEDEAYRLENRLIFEHKGHGFLVNVAGVENPAYTPQKTNGLTKGQRLKQFIQERLEKEQKERLEREKVEAADRKEREMIEYRKRNRDNFSGENPTDKRSRIQHESWLRRKHPELWEQRQKKHSVEETLKELDRKIEQGRLEDQDRQFSEMGYSQPNKTITFTTCEGCGSDVRYTFSGSIPHDTWLCKTCYIAKYDIDPTVYKPLFKNGIDQRK